MNAVAIDQLRRWERTALAIAAVAAILAIVLGLRTTTAVVPAWRLAAFICLQPALGSLIFLLIHRLTGGQWMDGLAPFLLAGTRLLPWIWVLILPLVIFPLAGQPRLARHADHATSAFARSAAPAPPSPAPTPVASSDDRSETANAVPALEAVMAESTSRHLGAPLRWYFSRPMMIARALFYAVAFFLYAAGARRAFRATTTLRWFGPFGLISLVILLHLLATDWLNLLDPGWYSTAFPLVWITAQAVAGLGAATAAAVLAGAQPEQRGTSSHIRGIDWGNLLLASVMSWAYVTFLQFLIIWSGNLPAETSWYRHRSSGGWLWLLIGVAVIEFATPFFLLLSRGVKRRRRGLAVAALILLAGQGAYTIWLIAPAFPRATSHAPGLMAVVLLAAVMLFLNRYLARARTIAAELSP